MNTCRKNETSFIGQCAHFLGIPLFAGLMTALMVPAIVLSQSLPAYAADDDTSPTPTKRTAAVSEIETEHTNPAGQTLPDYSDLHAGDITGQTLTRGLYKWSTGSGRSYLRCQHRHQYHSGSSERRVLRFREKDGLD